MLITGKIRDKSKIKSLSINNDPITLIEKNGEYEFFSNINVTGIDSVKLIAYDDYDNPRKIAYRIFRTETNAPQISIMAPYASDDRRIYLDNNSPSLFIQGRITDESKIKSIFIEGVTASYPLNELNPVFTATVDILNKNKIIVEVEDIYGNKQSNEFDLNREGANLAQTNPMGKTWVIFIENSKYSTFASLDGPLKDYNLMMQAFSGYQIHNYIRKQNMTKAEMERFFSIELRDLIRTNQVKSLLIWYAGHGKFINDVGYWIPVDAKRDDEFTYFNLNTLRASMEPYLVYLTHTLVVTDACESGPSFYQAMRSDLKREAATTGRPLSSNRQQAFHQQGMSLQLTIRNLQGPLLQHLQIIQMLVSPLKK